MSLVEQAQEFELEQAAEENYWLDGKLQRLEADRDRLLREIKDMYDYIQRIADQVQKDRQLDLLWLIEGRASAFCQNHLREVGPDKELVAVQ